MRLDFVIFILSLKVELLLAFAAVPSPEARLGFPPASSVELLHLISGHSAGSVLFLPQHRGQLCCQFGL